MNVSSSTFESDIFLKNCLSLGEFLVNLEYDWQLILMLILHSNKTVSFVLIYLMFMLQLFHDNRFGASSIRPPRRTDF